jgi:hypothetical protein
MAKRLADKNIIEGLAVAAMAAESFLKVYYKAKKDLEGVYAAATKPAKVASEKKIAQAITKRRRAIMRNSL